MYIQDQSASSPSQIYSAAVTTDPLPAAPVVSGTIASEPQWNHTRLRQPRDYKILEFSEAMQAEREQKRLQQQQQQKQLPIRKLSHVENYVTALAPS
jgi:hypothetical protein